MINIKTQIKSFGKDVFNQKTKLLQIICLFLIIAISFGLGRISIARSSIQKDVVISEKVKERLVLNFEKIEDSSLVFETSVSSVAQLGEDVLSIQDNRFVVPMEKIGDLVVYNQDQEINFSGFTGLVASEQVNSAEPQVAGDSHTTRAVEGSSGAITSTPESVAKKVFVGSKNSNKYHPPDCRWAKKIKPENEIWFSSHQDAQNKGYIKSSCFK